MFNTQSSNSDSHSYHVNTKARYWGSGVKNLRTRFKNYWKREAEKELDDLDYVFHHDIPPYHFYSDYDTYQRCTDERPCQECRNFEETEKAEFEAYDSWMREYEAWF